MAFDEPGAWYRQVADAIQIGGHNDQLKPASRNQGQHNIEQSKARQSHSLNVVQDDQWDSGLVNEEFTGGNNTLPSFWCGKAGRRPLA